MNKPKLESNKILGLIVAVAAGVSLRFILGWLGLPLIGCQISVLGAAYFLGPVYGVAVALITGGLCAILDPVNALYILPMVILAILCGTMAKRENFLNNLYHTVSVICFFGTIEAVVFGLLEAVILRDHTTMSYSDTVYKYLTHYGFPMPLRFFIAALAVVYIDVTFALLFLWLYYILTRPMKKWLGRRRYLRRNMAGMLALVLVGGMLMPLGQTEAHEEDEANNYINVVYDASNGLAGGAANDMVQTSDGTMWVATYGGLYRFNGEKFELISDIPNVRSVVRLYVDSDSHMWIGNNSTGLAVTNSDRTVATLDTSNGMPSDNIRDIDQVDDSTYAISTAKGLVMVDYDGHNASISQILCVNQYINETAVASDGTIALCNNSNEILIIRHQQVAQTIEPTDANFIGVQFDDQDHLYVGTDSNEVIEYEQSGDEFVQTRAIDTGNLVAINDLYFDDSGSIFVAADNGLGYLDSEYELHEIYVDNFNSGINHIFKDYQDNLWFVSNRCGILSMVKSGFSDIFGAYGVPECVVNSVTMWKSKLYVGTDAGLYVLDPATHTSMANDLTAEHGEYSRIRCVKVDSKNSLWVCDYNQGVCEVTASGATYRYNSDLPGYQIGNKPRFVYELANGKVVISTIEGVAVVENHQVVQQYLCGQDTCSSYLLCAYEREDGTILGGSDGDGVQVFKNGQIEQVIGRSDGLSSSIVMKIVDDPFGEGQFVMTGSGLCYLNEDLTVYELSNFPYYNNMDMYIADDGTVAVLSTAGIYILSYDELMGDCAKYTLLDNSTGLPCTLTSNAWNYYEDDGTLYLSGGNGLYSMNLHNYGLQVDTYKPTISAYILDGELTPSTNVNEIVVPVGTESLGLTVEINNFTPMDPYVRYYLSGVDENKNVCLSSDLSTVYYENLPYGSYRFVVEVLDDSQQRVISQNKFIITKEMEPYESWAFKTHFYLTLAWIIISFMSAISNVATYESGKRQKIEYEMTLNQLEREKAQALERALDQEARANKSKSDFLASMSHEIRTPINAVIGMDTMILRETRQDSVRRYANDVKTASETLLALINDILDFSKIESGKMELAPGDYDVSSMINDLINMVRPKVRDKGLELNISISPDIPAVMYGDDVRIKQIILNALNNAVKYTEKGHIDFTMDVQPADMGEVALSVSIADTGIGIKEEDITKLFSPYERIEEGRNKKIEGTGLGMSITKNLLALMNSHLVVESVYGEGSTFSFTILQPVKSEETIGNFEERLAAAEAQSVAAESYHAPDAQILVVDDVEMNLQVATLLLKRIEAQVTTALSGKDAIELAKARKFDIIFLDSMMPDLNGEETLQIMRQECHTNDGTPIIVLTANAIKGAKEEYLAAGFDNYLSKPIDGDKFEAMIREYLPEDKVITEFESAEPEEELESTGDEFLDAMGAIEGIDVTDGVEAAGGREIYGVVCRNFYDTGAERIAMIEDYYGREDWPNYTIQVHALKSSAKLIGAFDLSEKALEMELAGKEENIALIHEKSDTVVNEYRRILMGLESVFGQADGTDTAEDDTRDELPAEDLKQALRDMSELLEAFDHDTARDLFDSLADYRLPADFAETCKAMRTAFAEVDRDSLLAQITDYISR